eukprot:gene15250-biopygen14251
MACKAGTSLRAVCVWGGGGVHFQDLPERIPARKSAPRDARPPPPGARPGRAEGADGTGGWSSFPTKVSGHRPVPSWRPQFRNFHNLSRVGARDLESPAFAPRSEPPHARAPGVQIIRMASGTSGWRVGISTLRTERERGREQVGYIRCWGGTSGEVGL